MPDPDDDQFVSVHDCLPAEEKGQGRGPVDFESPAARRMIVRSLRPEAEDGQVDSGAGRAFSSVTPPTWEMTSRDAAAAFSSTSVSFRARDAVWFSLAGALCRQTCHTGWSETGRRIRASAVKAPPRRRGILRSGASRIGRHRIDRRTAQDAAPGRTRDAPARSIAQGNVPGTSAVLGADRAASGDGRERGGDGGAACTIRPASTIIDFEPSFVGRRAVPHSRGTMPETRPRADQKAMAAPSARGSVAPSTRPSG